MAVTLIDNTEVVGQVSLESQVFDVRVSSNVREGTSPRPFILKDDKKSYLNKDAREVFTNEYFRGEEVLHLENLSRVRSHTDTVEEVHNEEVIEQDDLNLHVVSSHSSTPFDLSKVFDQAVRESNGNLPQEFVFIKRYDQVKEDFDGDLDAYLAAGLRKSKKLKWEVLHVTGGKIDGGVRAGEPKKLWFRFSSATNACKKQFPDLPVYRHRKGKTVRVKKK